MKKLLICAALVSFASPTLASTVSLKCVLNTKEGPEDWLINLDEKAGTITYWRSQAAGQILALFTPDEVSAEDGHLRIDLTNLSIRRQITVGGQSYADDLGKCEFWNESRAS